MSLVQFQNAEVSALNGQSTYKSKAGSFNLVFEISGGANMALDLNSLRLVMEVDYLTGSGQHLNNFNIYHCGLSNVDGVAGNAATDATPAYSNATESFINVDTRTGVNSIINSILWQDSENNTLEHVYSFPHLMNKVSSLTMSKDDMLTWGGSSFGIKSGGKTLVNLQAINSTQDIALKLYTGLSQSAPIPYSVAKGKIKLQIQLNSSSSVFNSGDLIGANFGLGTARGSQEGGCYYEIRKVKLIYKNLIFDDDTAPILKSGYTYKHFSTLQSTINSSNNTNIYNPNSSNAISILTSFISSDNLNNYSKNSIQSDYLKNEAGAGIYPSNIPQSCKIHSVDFLKNNVSFPLQYPIDESIYTRNFDGKNNYEVQRSYYYSTTLTPFNLLNKILLCPATEAYGPSNESKSPDFNVPVSAGVGIRYANVSSMDGTSFKNGRNFQQKIESELNGTLTNEMFSNVMSTKTIVPASNGAVVLA